MSTYYVAVTGNDSAAGTEGSPWRLPHVGLSRCAPGDTVYVRNGTYDDGFNNNVPSGTSWSTKIRIAAYPGETVWLRPTGAGTTGAGNNVYINGTSASYVEFDGINFDNRLMPASGIYIGNASGATVHHLRFQNLELFGGDQQAYTNIHIGGTDHEFLNVTVHGGGLPGGCGTECSVYGYYITGNRILVDRGHIYDVSAYGVHIYLSSGTPTGNVIRNCRIHDITESGTGLVAGILVSGNDNLVYNNLIYGVDLNASPADAGIQIYTGARNKVWNNTIADNNTTGIKIDPGASSTEVRNNIVFGNTLTAFVNNGSGTTSTNNIGPSGASGWTNVNPQFANAAGGDYHLNDNSPAIDAGATITTVTTDHDGGTRPTGAAYDVGAFEFGAFGGSPGSPPIVPVESPPDFGSPGSPGDAIAGSPGASDDIPASGGLTIVTEFYSDHDMQCPENWYGGFKQGRVIRFGDGERAFSNMYTGEWSGSTFDLSISDFDRTLRGQLNSATNRYWMEPLTIRMTTRANRAVLGTPYTVFVGPIIDIRPQNPLILDLTLGDIVSQALITDDQLLPWRIIRDGFLNELDEIAEALDLDAPEPIIYGSHRRVPDQDPASPQGFQVTPTYLGKEGSYHVWMVCGHACTDIPDVLVWTPDEFGGLGSDTSVLVSGDWLIPHTSAPAYEDRRSVTYGNDRRYTLIRGLSSGDPENPSDADSCAIGEKTLTCFVEGVEETGDGTGALITDRLQQYKHFLINFVVNRGPLSYQSGEWLENIAWELFDGNVLIVNEESFDDASAIAIERLPALVSGGDAGYIGAAIIGATPSDRASVKEWIAKWNASCSVSFGVNHFGQLIVSMLHPTDAIKAAAPLYTDAYEILEGSFSTEVRWMDKANRIPWRADYEFTSGQWKTSDVASSDEAITLYGQEIQGEIREYPFAPGETAANHLAQMELRTRTHPRRIVALDATVGPDCFGDSLGYRDLGSYIRFKHFDAVSADRSEIRLGYVIKHQVQAGSRRVRAICMDVEDLIGFDTFDAGTAIDVLNDTCANAIVITPGEIVNYTIEINTTAHEADPTISGLCGSPGGAYNAAWWSYTAPQAQTGHVTTGTSGYDTILSVWTGSCGALTLVECNDNDGIFETSFIEFTDANFLQAGVTYHFLVTSHGSPGGGNLVFTFFAEPL